MILIHLIELDGSIIGACVDYSHYPLKDGRHVTVTEAEHMTNTPASDWVYMDIESIDYRNLELTPANTSPALLRLIRQGG